MTVKHNVQRSITDENCARCARASMKRERKTSSTLGLPQCFTDGNEDDFLASLVLMPALATERVVKGTFGFVKSNDYILMKEETNDLHPARKIVRSESRFFFSSHNSFATPLIRQMKRQMRLVYRTIEM